MPKYRLPGAQNVADLRILRESPGLPVDMQLPVMLKKRCFMGKTKSGTNAISDIFAPLFLQDDLKV